MLFDMWNWAMLLRGITEAECEIRALREWKKW